MADETTSLRRCIGSARFGIEAHEAPDEDFPTQPSWANVGDFPRGVGRDRDDAVIAAGEDGLDESPLAEAPGECLELALADPRRVGWVGAEEVERTSSTMRGRSDVLVMQI